MRHAIMMVIMYGIILTMICAGISYRAQHPVRRIALVSDTVKQRCCDPYKWQKPDTDNYKDGYTPTDSSRGYNDWFHQNGVDSVKLFDQYHRKLDTVYLIVYNNEYSGGPSVDTLRITNGKYGASAWRSGCEPPNMRPGKYIPKLKDQYVPEPWH